MCLVQDQKRKPALFRMIETARLPGGFSPITQYLTCCSGCRRLGLFPLGYSIWQRCKLAYRDILERHICPRAFVGEYFHYETVFCIYDSIDVWSVTFVLEPSLVNISTTRLSFVYMTLSMSGNYGI